jgi:hypothetical protein
MTVTRPIGDGRTGVVIALGTTQTISWASSYYLPAVLAVPIARELGLPNAWIFGAFSAALIVMALLGPLVGRQIDLKGGRVVLALSHIVIAGGLVLLASAGGTGSMALAWGMLGVGMAMGLYDAAFSALAGFYGADARRSITGITLIAGFASTIGWPIHALLEAAYGWRVTCLVWATVHLLVCLPLALTMLPRQTAPTAATSADAKDGGPDAVSSGATMTRSMWLIALMFSVAWFVTGAMATHLPRLLQELGATPTAAIAAAALVGPAQVAARVVEFSLLGKLHPLVSARTATLLHPLGAGLLAFFGAPAVALFTILHGAGNGLLTIVKGTLPLALFGPHGYGLRQGLLAAPARFSQATAPFLFSLVLDASALAALALSSALLLIAFGLLNLLGRQAE